MRLISFAAGVLLATVFLELLPEAGHEAGGANPLIASLVAMVSFFFLERILHGFHLHDGRQGSASRYLILVGDGFHNLIDGIIIGAAFVADPELGVATTLAVTAHEIPQELADYGILVSGGFSRRRALALNFGSGLLGVLGALLTVTVGDAVEDNVSWFVAGTAGMFLYIAAVDLIPQMQQEDGRRSATYGPPFVAGIAVMALVTTLIGD